MKVIIAGSRNITDTAVIERAIAASGFRITEVVCGEARGADALGKLWAVRNRIPVRSFPADWDGPAGKSAGVLRNNEMADYADALIAAWDGKSPGTQHMIAAMRRHRKKPTYVLTLNKSELPTFF